MAPGGPTMRVAACTPDASSSAERASVVSLTSYAARCKLRRQRRIPGAHPRRLGGNLAGHRFVTGRICLGALMIGTETGDHRDDGQHQSDHRRGSQRRDKPSSHAGSSPICTSC